MLTVSAKLPRENNKEFSYRIIKEAIMSLQLQPGQVLRDVELAEMLRLSRTPIREVMSKLREEYLVEVFPQVGTYVSKIKPQLIEEAAFMRFVLEKETLKLACKSFPRESIDLLKKNLDLQEMLLDQKGIEWELQKLDTNFHFILFQGNQRNNTWKAITQLATHYNRMTILSQRDDHFDAPISHHKTIISIIENKEIDQVENILRKHILEPIKGWRNLYSKESSYASYFDFAEKSSVLV